MIFLTSKFGEPSHLLREDPKWSWRHYCSILIHILDSHLNQQQAPFSLLPLSAHIRKYNLESCATFSFVWFDVFPFEFILCIVSLAHIFLCCRFLQNNLFVISLNTASTSSQISGDRYSLLPEHFGSCGSSVWFLA